MAIQDPVPLVMPFGQGTRPLSPEWLQARYASAPVFTSQAGGREKGRWRRRERETDGGEWEGEGEGEDKSLQQGMMGRGPWLVPSPSPCHC